MNFLRSLLNIPGWKTNRKIIVFESDDWGAIRMPSKKSYNDLLKNNICVNKSFYNKYDALESNDDLEALFSTLIKYKDKNGNHPVFTALSIVANPDFEKIRKSNLSEYCYDSILDTLSNYGNKHNHVYTLWHEGINNSIFYPEFHGREHLHVMRWMKLINTYDEYKVCFDYNFFGIRPNELAINEMNHLPAFDLNSDLEIDGQKIILKEGIELFKKIYKYDPSLFVPPNGLIHEDLEFYASEVGINFLYGAKRQPQPLGKNKFRFTGKKNKLNQIFLGRNVQFEPTKSKSEFEWEKAINEIEQAFRWKKPAIISTHRVNYIGFIDENNRTKGLYQLDRLISKILTKWPDAEFLTSGQLGDLITHKSTK